MHLLVMTNKTIDEYGHNSWCYQVVDRRISITG